MAIGTSKLALHSIENGQHCADMIDFKPAGGMWKQRVVVAKKGASIFYAPGWSKYAFFVWN